MSNLFKKTIFLPEIWSKLSIGFERASPPTQRTLSKLNITSYCNRPDTSTDPLYSEEDQ